MLHNIKFKLWWQKIHIPDFWNPIFTSIWWKMFPKLNVQTIGNKTSSSVPVREIHVVLKHFSLVCQYFLLQNNDFVINNGNNIYNMSKVINFIWLFKLAYSTWIWKVDNETIYWKTNYESADFKYLIIPYIVLCQY